MTISVKPFRRRPYYHEQQQTDHRYHPTASSTLHSLGDYAQVITEFGTTDSFSTQTVREHTDVEYIIL